MLKFELNYLLKPFVFLCGLFVWTTVLSQSDTPCSGAPALPVNAACVYTTGTTVGANQQTNAGNFGAPSCGSMGEDVWYTFTAPAGGAVNISTQAAGITDGVMAVYESDCSTFSTELDCDDDSGPGLMPEMSLTGLTAGDTYYVRFWDYGGGTGTFDICISEPAPPPANDDCSGAVPLTVNPDYNCGTTTTGSVESATASSQANGCFGTDDDDVWFSFVAAGTEHSVDLLNVSGSVTDLYHAVYAGACGSIGAAIECSDPNSSTLTGLTPGNTYYVRVYTYTSTPGQNTSFDICIGSPPPPPVNDDCNNATTAPVNPDLNCGSTTSGYTTGATTSSQTNDCFGTADDDVWYEFTATNVTHYIDLLNVSGSTSDLYHSVYAGNCGSPGAALECSDPNSSVITGLTPGNTYFIRIYTYSSFTHDVSFDLCIGTPPPPPSNDECTGATSLTVNPDDNCGTVTPGTISSATPSSQTNDCFGTADDDVWFSFVATNTSHYVDLLNIAGTTTDMYHSVYAGNCGSIGAAIECSDPNSSILTGLTIGNTYYVRVFTYTSSSGQNTDFDVCIGTPPPPPANDDCPNAEPVSVSSGTCTYTAGTVSSATTSTQTNDCFGTADDDVWYSFVATDPSAQIQLNNVTGSTTDLYHSVYSGTCGSIGSAIVCSDPNTSSVTGLTPGNTYYVRIYSYTGTSGQTTNFDLCILETGACGTPENQDYCVAPAILTQGGGNFSGNTSGTYTDDEPANLNSVFCGSIENNSWYSFTAMSTTESFNFTSVTGCTSGIQAEVFEVTEDVNGCCDNFTSMSNCWNPISATSGTVTATGLTVGNEYILMVDGYGGDICDFTVSNWTAYGILTVTLLDFNGLALPEENLLSWTTKSETENDYFQVERSYDGIQYESIGKVNGAGNSVATNNYEFFDDQVRMGEVYYRLKQVDFNGEFTYTDVIVLNREASHTGLISIWPNPSKEFLNIEVNPSIQGGQERLKIINTDGRIVYSKSISSENYKIYQLDLQELPVGVYVIVLEQANGKVQREKFVKL